MVATVLELLSLIARWAGRGENVDCSEPVSRAVILMSNSVERGISVKSVAAEVGLSPSSLRRRFVAEMGMSPYHYFNTLRINQIKMDLAHTAQPLKKIAERLGFTDQYHLSRLFKHYVGVSPSAWRATGG
jgi:AraC-like DNA-binding protein